MIRTVLFVFVIGFTLSARALVSVSHINHGIPSHCGIDSIDTASDFFTTNNIPIVGYTRESNNNLNFTFNIKVCSSYFIKTTSFTADYALLNSSTLLVKLQINPEYSQLLSEQTGCTTNPLNSEITQLSSLVNVKSDIQKLFGDSVDFKALTIILANDYQDEHNLLDISSSQKIEDFVGQRR